MSQENVKIVRRLYDTTNGRLDAGLGFLAPEIELHLSELRLACPSVMSNPRGVGHLRFG